MRLSNMVFWVHVFLTQYWKIIVYMCFCHPPGGWWEPRGRRPTGRSTMIWHDNFFVNFHWKNLNRWKTYNGDEIIWKANSRDRSPVLAPKGVANQHAGEWSKKITVIASTLVLSPEGKPKRLRRLGPWTVYIPVTFKGRRDFAAIANERPTIAWRHISIWETIPQRQKQ